MTLITKNDFKAEMQFKGIELLGSTMALPTDPNASPINYYFNIAIETKVDSVTKLVFVVVLVEIKSDDHSLILGSIRVSCIFEIQNFEEVIKANEAGIFELNPILNETLNIISISTTRGAMFANFKGTYLHNAILPIIDPMQIQKKINS